MPDRSQYRPEEYGDLATVESQRNEVISEEFPEGSYGMSLPVETLGKSTPWRADQRRANPYGYENLELHEGMPRNYPPDHHTNDEPGDNLVE
jgi:hypothetical protein